MSVAGQASGFMYLSSRSCLAVLALAIACVGPPEERVRTVPIGYDGELVTWWNAKSVKERGTYVSGQRDGPVEAFHKEGTPHFYGVFVLGRPHGELTTYHSNGFVAAVEHYDNGVLDGTVQRFSTKTGAPVEFTEYSGGLKNGVEQHWGSTGRLVFEGRWVRNLPSGKWRHWDALGRMVRDEHYWIVGGVPVGYLETIYAADGIASAQTLKRFDGDAWVGWVTTWHTNGRQSSLLEERAGLGNGRDVSWDKTGRLVAEGWRLDGERNGTWTFFGLPGEETRTVVYAREHPVETMDEVLAEREAEGVEEGP